MAKEAQARAQIKGDHQHENFCANKQDRRSGNIVVINTKQFGPLLCPSTIGHRCHIYCLITEPGIHNIYVNNVSNAQFRAGTFVNFIDIASRFADFSNKGITRDALYIPRPA